LGLLGERDLSRSDVWSCGGGTQSAAIAALIVRGDLPRPTHSVIVDTGREKSSTWAYYESTLRPRLSAVGVDLVRLPKDRFATVDLYSHKGELLLPTFTTTGKLQTFCSAEWKRDVITRWARSVGVEKANNWIGISADELRRVRQGRRQWFSPWYPLVEMGLRRVDCVRLVESMGWPTPPRSSCWCCSNMGPREWQELKDHAPDDWARAVNLERELRARDPGVYLHGQRVPLPEVLEQTSMTGLDNGCTSGLCFV